METKKCSKCGEVLPATLEYFHAMKYCKFGVRSACKSCNKEYMSAYRATDKAKKEHAEKMKIWRQKNPDKQRAIVKRNYEKHSLRVNAEKKERYKNDAEYRAKRHEIDKRYKESGRRREVNSTPENRKKAAERRKKRYYSNVEREKEEMAKWKEKNPNYMKEKMKERLVKMPDSFIINHILRYSNLTKEDITPEMIETKRLLIQLKRECGMTAYKYNQLNKK